MKKLLLICALLFSAQAQAAGTAPANMTASGAIVGSQIVWCPTGLSADFKCTFTQVAAYINSLVSGDCTANGTGTFTCTKVNGNPIGTSGAALGLLNGNNTYSGTNTHSGTNTFGAVVGATRVVTITTDTLAAADCGKTITYNNASTVTVTIPQGLPIVCVIAIMQLGAGVVKVNGSAVTPATFHTNVGGGTATGTGGQYSTISITNYIANTVVMAGDGL